MIQSVSFRAMGCQVEIKLDTDLKVDALLSQMPAQFEALEDCLSRFRPQSELMQFNALAGEWVSLSDVLFGNIHQAKHMARLTNGLFNPLVLPALVASGYNQSFEQLGPASSNPPMIVADWRVIELNVRTMQVRIPVGSAIDLGGIAKGWSAQYIANQLAEYGPCLVNIGGDIVTRAAPAGLPGWRIDVADPDSTGDLTTLWLRDVAIVTSGVDFRRWTTVEGQSRHHIIDPLTGEPAQTDVRTVTIIHPHPPTAEAYAKAVLLKGSEAGLRWLDTRWHAAGLVVRQDAAVLATHNFVTYLQERIAT
ncbi:MAG: FAD:protein FMN transferase [Anaerolineae bacterium]|nr:FAD:protein FMN transferase [Anaerolineae bacterium]